MPDTDCLRDYTSARRITVDGSEYRYRAYGNGAPIVLLPGTIGDENLFCLVAERISAGHRLFSFEHPRAARFSDAVGILARLLQASGALGDDAGRPGGLVLGGSSVGGRLAQYLAARLEATRAGTVRGLIIGNSFCENRTLRAKTLTPYRASRLIPERRLLSMFAENNRVATMIYPAGGEIGAYLSANVQALGKRGLRGRLWWSLERLPPPDVPAGVPKLIIYTHDDPVIPSNTRENLLARYPEATRCALDYGGHFPYLTNPAPYAEAILDFLATLGRLTGADA